MNDYLQKVKKGTLKTLIRRIPNNILLAFFKYTFLKNAK